MGGFLLFVVVFVAIIVVFEGWPKLRIFVVLIVEFSSLFIIRQLCTQTYFYYIYLFMIPLSFIFFYMCMFSLFLLFGMFSFSDFIPMEY